MCCGCGFVRIPEIDQVCNVVGFHPDMQPIKDVPVCTCANAFDHPDGETFILEFGLAFILWRLDGTFIVEPKSNPFLQSPTMLESQKNH
jgi:hypothetical protein